MSKQPRSKEDKRILAGVNLLKDNDEKKSLITVDSWMRMAWKDSKLSWNPKDYKEFNGSMHFDSDELWKPDVLLYNK